MNITARRLFTTFVIVSAMTISGCNTLDPYTGEEKVSNTAKGAGIGAGIGAVLAYVQNRDESSKKRKKRMLQAAGIGAIAGGGVGHYMDNQEAKLRETLRNTGVSVERNGDNINLIMPANITFANADHKLNGDFYDVLDSVVLVLQEFDKTVIVVAGYTDNVGEPEYNQALSERRSYSVVQYLLSREIIPVRVETIGFGETAPIADNATGAGRGQNRRVELSLLPITEGA
jgi:outer membrane protein OmpA-like peptidoglycan-associated protein